MKTLILVRHAKAVSDDPSVSDMDRPLEALGRRDAAVMADQLEDLRLPINAIVSSPALRARETAEIFAKKLSRTVQERPQIYNASEAELLKVVRRFKENCGTVLLVGHNPGVSALLCTLTGQVYHSMPSGAVAVLGLKVSKWKKIVAGKAVLQTSFTPRQGPLRRVSGGAIPPMSRTDQFRLWRFQRANRLELIVVLVVGILLVLGVVILAMHLGTNPSAMPKQGR